VNKVFSKLQLVSSAAFSLGHGANDAQKTMGIIAILLFSSLRDPNISESFKSILSGVYDVNKGFYVPEGLAIACYLLMATGTILGGSNVIKTLGSGLAKLKPVKGFCAECSGAFTLIAASLWGIPISTTHTITGSIIGVGITDGVKSVKWATAKSIIWAWVLTIPAPLVISGILYLLMYRFI
jgi:Phosphate/sulphate permeases